MVARNAGFTVGHESVLPQLNSDPCHVKTTRGDHVGWYFCILAYALWSCTGSGVAIVHYGHCVR